MPRLPLGALDSGEIDTGRSPRSHPVRSIRLGTAVVGAIAAVAAAIAVVLGVSLVNDNNRITDLQGAAPTGTHSAVVAALRASGHKVVNLESPSHRLLAQFVVVPDGRGYLVKSNLPELSSDDTYQLWGLIGGRAISLGLLGRSPNQVTFTSAGSRTPSALAITVEPAGGAVTPTGSMLATGVV
jgi:anti-sigma-K factor RskA